MPPPHLNPFPRHPAGHAAGGPSPPVGPVAVLL